MTGTALDTNVSMRSSKAVSSAPVYAEGSLKMRLRSNPAQNARGVLVNTIIEADSDVAIASLRCATDSRSSIFNGPASISTIVAAGDDRTLITLFPPLHGKSHPSGENESPQCIYNCTLAGGA